mmetsp:Transcript_29179/g.62031  ORF Transcript_29179/g.62031 Transcript_29179/m.62031 type:complete len:265 (+) Transcript_29179:126-920(+)
MPRGNRAEIPGEYPGSASKISLVFTTGLPSKFLEAAVGLPALLPASRRGTESSRSTPPATAVLGPLRMANATVAAVASTASAISGTTREDWQATSWRARSDESPDEGVPAFASTIGAVAMARSPFPGMAAPASFARTGSVINLAVRTICSSKCTSRSCASCWAANLALKDSWSSMFRLRSSWRACSTSSNSRMACTCTCPVHGGAASMCRKDASDGARDKEHVSAAGMAQRRSTVSTSTGTTTDEERRAPTADAPLPGTVLQAS